MKDEEEITWRYGGAQLAIQQDVFMKTLLFIFWQSFVASSDISLRFDVS